LRPFVEGILLAAGESRRMGFPKPLLRIDDETFLARAAATMLSAVERLIIVTGAHRERVEAAVPQTSWIVVVHNANWPLGQLSSIKTGLVAVSADAAGVVVHLADHPLVRPETVQGIVDKYRQTGKLIAVARHAGHRGHPVLFDRSVFGEILEAPDDQGARVVVNADPERVVYLDVDDAGVILDLDTPADLVKVGLAPPPEGYRK
jgi:molybdenum cofactor cytidylyltransferase